MKLELNRSIVRKIAAFDKAKQALVDEILKQQRKCKHEVVWEVPWQNLEYGGCLNALRMCVACRYVEEGSHWSGGTVWSRNHKDGKPLFKPVLANKLFAPQISRDEFYALRLPVSVPDYVELDFEEEARREAARFPYMACPQKSQPLDELQSCGECGGVGLHESIPNPDFVSPTTQVQAEVR